MDLKVRPPHELTQEKAESGTSWLIVSSNIK